MDKIIQISVISMTYGGSDDIASHENIFALTETGEIFHSSLTWKNYRPHLDGWEKLEAFPPAQSKQPV